MAYRKKDEDEALSRADYGGSYWDQKYMTDDELRDAYDVRRAAERGEVTWDDAHDYVENTRARYGYSGGKHGDAYVKTDDKPVMPDDYGAAYREAVRRYTDMAPFSYDHRADPRWQAYKKEYAREGARATEDTLGRYAAMTGGAPSTAAVTAASQAGDYYAAKLADKVPELYDLAYAMYTGEADRLYRQLSALQAARGGELDRYRTQLNQWNADRDRVDALGQQAWERAYRERAYEDSRADAEYDRALSEEARAKPAFTAAQVMELIKNPTYASAPNVRAAYEYYFGQPYEGTAGSAPGAPYHPGGPKPDEEPDEEPTTELNGDKSIRPVFENRRFTPELVPIDSTFGVGASSAADNVMTWRDYNMAGRGIIEAWDRGDRDGAVQQLIAVAPHLTEEQRKNLINTLDLHGISISGL